MLFKINMSKFIERHLFIITSVDFIAKLTKTLPRKTFNDDALRVLQQYGFDGIDLDWEYPACWQGKCTADRAKDKANFVLWVKELHELFQPKGLLVTAAVSASMTTIDAAYDVKPLGKYLDYLNIMSYDFHGSWDSVTGHNSPMYSCNGDLLNTDTAVRYWIQKGFPANKVS